jgi:hypothetical protein
MFPEFMDARYTQCFKFPRFLLTAYFMVVWDLVSCPTDELKLRLQDLNFP